MSAQFAPDGSQRCHWYVKVAGAPAHVPGVAVRVWAASAVPEIVGGAVFFGASSALIRPAMTFASWVINDRGA